MFRSYGVIIRLESDSENLLDQAKLIAEKAFLGRLEFIENCTEHADHTFAFGARTDGGYYLIDNGELKPGFEDLPSLLTYFTGMLRVNVAAKATSVVFIHAGTVGWKGKALVMPGASHQGKTTLVAEMVRLGAEYFSDEYAVLDEGGLVHPFERNLSVREKGSSIVHEVPVSRLGGKVAERPLPVGFLAITRYEPDFDWEPRIVTTGQGIIEIVPHVIPIRFNTEFSLKVLNTAFSRAIITISPRGEARQAAESILSFVDNGLN